MNSINPDQQRPMTAVEYAENWVLNSADIDRDGGYAWMARQLAPAGAVLDIGAGSGRGVARLASQGARVICLEPNTRLLDLAEFFLKQQGLNVNRCLLQNAKELAPKNSGSVLLVEADILDPAVSAAIPQNYFDAMTCWLLGTYPAHMAPALGVTLPDLGTDSGSIYRARIHARCSNLAMQLVRKGGALQLTDRRMISSWKDKGQLRPEVMREYQELVGTAFSIALKDVLFFKMGSGISSSQIQHVYHGLPAANGAHVYQSVVARLL